MVTLSFYSVTDFGHILVTNLTNGHKFKHDKYKPISVSVSIEMFGMKEIRQNMPESELCFCFLFGIRIGTALRAVVIRIPDRKQKQRSLSGIFCWILFTPNYFLEIRKRNRFVPVKFECVTICDIYDILGKRDGNMHVMYIHTNERG